MGPSRSRIVTGIIALLCTLILPSAIGLTQAIGSLYGNPKVIEPAALSMNFIRGEGTARVIVSLSSSSPRMQSERRFEDTAFRDLLKRQVQDAQKRVIDRLDAARVRLTNRFVYVYGFSAEVTAAGLEQLLEMPEVVSVSPDRVLKPHLAQGIPLIRAQSVRSTHNGTGVAIAICDTGIDTSHPMLGGGGFPNAKVIGGYDTGDNDNDPRPNPLEGEAHGTSCAGIAAGSLGAVGDYIGGVAYNAKLYALKISTGNTGSAYESDMIEAWEWCITHQNDDPANPILIISTSFGGGYFTAPCDAASPLMTAAAANAVAAGITLFVSSGNDGLCNGTGWPACISHVNAVGAVYDADIGLTAFCISTKSCIGFYQSACYAYDNWACQDSTTGQDQTTCYSSSAPFVRLLAPSNNTYTTDITGVGGYSYGDYTASFGGTSAACPYAAGAAACLQSAAKSIKGSFLTPAEVRLALTATGDTVTDSKSGIATPRVNLEEAVATLAGDSKTFSIFNDGNAELLITALQKRDNDPWFDFSPKAPISVAPGQSRSVTVWINWQLVPEGGDDDRILVVSNDAENSPYATGVFIEAYPHCSQPPVINNVDFNGCISELCSSPLQAVASDPCGGILSYGWTALDGGAIVGTGANVTFDPPNTGPHPCPYRIKLAVTSSASGQTAESIVGVHVKRAGDVDGNGLVNVMDKVIVRNHFGETPASPNWDPRADVDCNGIVNVADKVIVRNNFGLTGCKCE